MCDQDYIPGQPASIDCGHRRPRVYALAFGVGLAKGPKGPKGQVPKTTSRLPHPRSSVLIRRKLLLLGLRLVLILASG